MTLDGRPTRIEYLTRDGWKVGHANFPLLTPQRYVDRLTAKGKFGRATVLDDSGEPTAEVYVSPNIPRPARTNLVDDETNPDSKIPRRARPGETWCTLCENVHAEPHDGSCLL